MKRQERPPIYTLTLGSGVTLIAVDDRVVIQQPQFGWVWSGSLDAAIRLLRQATGRRGR